MVVDIKRLEMGGDEIKGIRLLIKPEAVESPIITESDWPKITEMAFMDNVGLDFSFLYPSPVH